MKTATLATAARPAITSTIGVLSDRALLRQTTTLVRHERHLQGAIIDHLAEIEARRLFLRRGCSSLFDYAARELGYSDAAAGRRIGAVRLCADQPGARERLRDGSLTLSAAAELQWAFDRQRRRGSIAGVASTAPAGAVAPATAAARADLPRSAPTEAPVLGGGALASAPAEAARADDPAADAAPAVRPSHAEAAPPLVLDAAGRQKLVEEASGKSARQVRRMLADLDPELAPPADRVRPLGDGRYELKAVIDADCQQGLEQLRGLLSHVDPRMTMGQLVGSIAQAAAAAAAGRRSSATTRAGRRAGRAPAPGRRRPIPSPLRRRRSRPRANATTLRRRRTPRSTSTRLRQRRGTRGRRGNRHPLPCYRPGTTRRLPPAPLRQRSGRKSGRRTRGRPRWLRGPGKKRRTDQPLPARRRPPPLRPRSRALRAARFRRR